MTIGIGVTSYNRPEHLKVCLDLISKHTKIDHKLYVAMDSDKDRKGIAYRKNECLRELRECDYIFLFDDDCFPINDDWYNVFIDAYKLSGQHHFIYTHPPIGSVVKYDEASNVLIYDNCNGCLMFMTKEAVEAVGGYNVAFGLYGYEHANYSNRIARAGLSPLGRYACPMMAAYSVYSLDIDYYMGELHQALKHKGSMSPIVALENSRMNAKIYQSDDHLKQPL